MSTWRVRDPEASGSADLFVGPERLGHGPVAAVRRPCAPPRPSETEATSDAEQSAPSSIRDQQPTEVIARATDADLVDVHQIKK